VKPGCDSDATSPEKEARIAQNFKCLMTFSAYVCQTSMVQCIGRGSYQGLLPWAICFLCCRSSLSALGAAITCAIGFLKSDTSDI
jgi:hypothetical protein